MDILSCPFAFFFNKEYDRQNEQNNYNIPEFDYNLNLITSFYFIPFFGGGGMEGKLMR